MHTQKEPSTRPQKKSYAKPIRTKDWNKKYSLLHLSFVFVKYL